MIKELMKQQIKDKHGIFLKVEPNICLYDIENLLTKDFGFYLWDEGKLYKESNSDINEIYNYPKYYMIYSSGKLIIFKRHVIVNALGKEISFTTKDILSSNILFREKKLNKLKKLINDIR